MKKILVTGGAGFIGSHVVEYLVNKGYNVIVYDNFSMGSIRNLMNVKNKVKIVKGDLLDYKKLLDSLKGVETVFHFAANPEVRLLNPQSHFENNIRATFNLLEAMRKREVKEIIFASSSTVYGDARILPTPENYAPLKPISIYGGTKLACEALISSYTYTYKFRSVILRYANIVGPRSKRGVIHDFVVKLKRNPHELIILGDGRQRKSYLWIEDTIEATITAWEKCPEKLCIFNVGSEDSLTVIEIAKIVIKERGLRNVKLKYTGGVEGGRGWVGDVKEMLLSIDKIKALGWKPKNNSELSVRLTVRNLLRENNDKV